MPVSIINKTIAIENGLNIEKFHSATPLIVVKPPQKPTAQKALCRSDSKLLLVFTYPSSAEPSRLTMISMSRVLKLSATNQRLQVPSAPPINTSATNLGDGFTV